MKSETESETVEQRAKRMVQQEVECCLSHLISALTKGYSESIKSEPLRSLCNQAFELCFPVLDYESAAYDAGMREVDGKWGDYESAEDYCDNERIAPYEHEILEHWAISDWLGRKLEEAGERVDFYFAGLTVWGRTTSGQGIANDAVILGIAKDILK